MTDLKASSLDRVGGSERIASLDVIRGIAILFILCMNIPWMAGYAPIMSDPRIPTWTILDQEAFSFVFAFLNGTQRGLLELLFGAGIMIMARKAMSGDGPVAVADLHFRRNLLLIALGLFNALVLLWPGDILLPYGLAAIFLFPFRTLKPKVQILLGIALLIGFPTMMGAREYVQRANLQQVAMAATAAKESGAALSAGQKAKLAEWNTAVARTRPVADNPAKQKMAEGIHQQRMGPFPGYVAHQWNTWAEIFKMPDIFWGLLAEIAATMLIGAGLFQLGIIQGKASAGTYAAMMVVGYGLGLSLRIWGLFELLEFSPSPKLFWIHGDISRLAVVLGHLGAIHLALRTGLGRALLKPFQAAGRMPLTTYLFTSFLMCWLLMPGIGLGLHGSMGRFGMLVLALSIIAAEVIATNIWMRYHETGPMEWLWKSLAYGKRQRYLRIAGPAPALVPAE